MAALDLEAAELGIQLPEHDLPYTGRPKRRRSPDLVYDLSNSDQEEEGRDNQFHGRAAELGVFLQGQATQPRQPLRGGMGIPRAHAGPELGSSAVPVQVPGTEQHLETDEQLALRLQEEEDAQLARRMHAWLARDAHMVGFPSFLWEEEQDGSRRVGLRSHRSGASHGPPAHWLLSGRTSPGGHVSSRQGDSPGAVRQGNSSGTARGSRLRRWDQRRPVGDATGGEAAHPSPTPEPGQSELLPGRAHQPTSTPAGRARDLDVRDTWLSRAQAGSPPRVGSQPCVPPRGPAHGPHMPPCPPSHIPATSSAPSLSSWRFSAAAEGAAPHSEPEHHRHELRNRPEAAQRVTSLEEEEEVLMDLDALVEEEQEQADRMMMMAGQLRGTSRLPSWVQHSARSTPPRPRPGSGALQPGQQPAVPAAPAAATALPPDGRDIIRPGGMGRRPWMSGRSPHPPLLHAGDASTSSSRGPAHDSGSQQDAPHASSFSQFLTGRHLRRRTGGAPQEEDSPGGAPWVRPPPPHYQAQPSRSSPARDGNRRAARDRSAQDADEQGLERWAMWDALELGGDEEGEEEDNDMSAAARGMPPAPPPPGLSASLQSLRSMLPRPVAMHPAPRNPARRSPGAGPPPRPHHQQQHSSDEEQAYRRRAPPPPPAHRPPPPPPPGPAEPHRPRFSAAAAGWSAGQEAAAHHYSRRSYRFMSDHHHHAMHLGMMGFGGPSPMLRTMLQNAMASGIPPELLLSDRDFTADDYELLCKLDETVENKKGATQQEIDALPLQVLLGEDQELEALASAEEGHTSRGGPGKPGAAAAAAAVAAAVPEGVHTPGATPPLTTSTSSHPGATRTSSPPRESASLRAAGRCTICLEDYTAGCTLRRLPCAHSFHSTCIDTWLKQRAVCPICQRTCR